VWRSSLSKSEKSAAPGDPDRWGKAVSDYLVEMGATLPSEEGIKAARDQLKLDLKIKKVDMAIENAEGYLENIPPEDQE